MAMTLTTTQMFLGGISLVIGLSRGSSVYTQLHHETLVGHASYGASKTATDHARAANIVVNDNVIMAAIMGPRFGVEADNITMDANAAIACPTCPKSPKCDICRQYKRNKPRALAKLVWVRAKQQALWGTLGKLSGDVDRLAAIQASAIVTADVSRFDPEVKITFDDPSLKGEIWGGANAAVACRLAMKDTLVSPVLGHAFPLLIRPNLLEGLPKVLVRAFPGKICGAAEAHLRLPEIKEVADKTREDCHYDPASGEPISDSLRPYLTCNADHCTFDREKCEEKELEKNSDRWVTEKLGLPKVTASLAASLGGSETRKPSADFCACTKTSRPIDGTVIGITDAIRKIGSFGMSGPSQALRRRHEYSSCGRWYFPDGRGEFAGVPVDEQPFVAAYKSALVQSCGGAR